MNDQLSTETKLLEIGDILYEYGNYGVYSKATVVKVTPKQATLSNNKKVERALYSRNRTYTIGGEKATSGLSHWRIETPELIEEWYDKNAREMLSKISWNSSKIDHCVLVNIINDLPFMLPGYEFLNNYDKQQ
jgi:hypothetical protein